MLAAVSRLLRIIERVVETGVWVSGSMLLLIAFLIGIDVIARKFFAVTLGGSDELAGYVLAISSAWAASYTLLKRGHIRMDVVYNRSGPRVQVALDVFALVAFASFMAVVTWYGFQVAATSFAFGSRANTPLSTPLWIPQSLWLIGLGMFMVTVLALILAATTAMLADELGEIRRRIGIAGPQEEVQDEIAAVRDRQHSSAASSNAPGIE